MQLLKDRIASGGKDKRRQRLKVDSFLNHQMDVSYFRKSGRNSREDLKVRRLRRFLRSKLLGSESHVLRLKYLMYRLYLQRRHRQRILQGMYIQQR